MPTAKRTLGMFSVPISFKAFLRMLWECGFCFLIGVESDLSLAMYMAVTDHHAASSWRASHNLGGQGSLTTSRHEDTASSRIGRLILPQVDPSCVIEFSTVIRHDP